MGMDERVHHLAARFPDVKVHLYGKTFRPGRKLGPEVKIGFVPAMVAAILRRNMSEKDAFATLTFGYEISVGELRDRGVVEGTINDENFDSEIIAIAKQYEKLSASAVQMTKRLVYDIDILTFDEAIEFCCEVNTRARMTEDCKKGIPAKN